MNEERHHARTTPNTCWTFQPSLGTQVKARKFALGTGRRLISWTFCNSRNGPASLTP